MFGRGYGYASGGTNSVPEWNSIVAKIYYEALKVADGVSDIDSVALYSVPVASFKFALDQMFSDLDTAGILSKIKRFTPRLGATLSANAINSINPGTYNSTFVNAPTVISTKGIGYDGATQKEISNFPCNAWDDVGNFGFTFFDHSTHPLTTYMSGIYSDAGSISQFKDGLNRWLTYMNGAGYVAPSISGNSYYTFVRTGVTGYGYRNGIDYDGPLVFPDSNPLTSQLMEEAGNAGGVLYYSSLISRMTVFHDYLTPSEVLTMIGVFQTFDTAINR